MDTSKITIVFGVKDREKIKSIYDAYKTGGLICGLTPLVIAWGDQITIPSEILNELIDIDVDFECIPKVKKLIELAEYHQSTCL